MRHGGIHFCLTACVSSLFWQSTLAGLSVETTPRGSYHHLPIIHSNSKSLISKSRKCSVGSRINSIDISCFLRGGSQSEPTVSVNADETLPPEIAGASLTAFQANKATVPVPVADSTHQHHHNTNIIDTNESVQAEPVVDFSIQSQDVAASPSKLAKRLADLRQRTLPAVLMLLVVGSIAKFLKEDGLIASTVLLQVAMYQETTKLIGGDFPHPFYKWWWFLTASIAINAPRIVSWASKEIAAGATGMAIFGLVSSILRFNHRRAEVEEFRDFLRQMAVSLMAIVLVVVPSSYWIATLEEFGMKWVALPAALVIINDTMAYFFGITLGRTTLLPIISPGKTLEGFLGATFSTSLASYWMLQSRQDAIALAVAVSLVGPFGGFFASLIKRAYVQKDFGALFPGHGGFVDRLDCQLILAPIVYLYLALTQPKK